jgi:hypothetical protein
MPAAESFRQMAQQPDVASGGAEQARQAQSEHHEGSRRALVP